jgi:membrane-associated phospholipid phosphatase
MVKHPRISGFKGDDATILLPAARGIVPALSILAAGVLGAGALLRDRLEWYDAYVEVLVSGLHTRFGVHDVRILSAGGPYVGAAIVGVALAVARWRGARPRELRRPLTALAIALLCVELLKLAIYRERPFSVGPAQHDSFPSGDTAQVALCAATALHLVALRRIARDRVRWGLVLAGAMTAIAVAFSRVYLGRHWASDVAASLLIGFVFWSAAPRWPPSMGKLAFTVVGIAVVLISGPPVVFPSPMAFDDQRHFELPVLGVGAPCPAPNAAKRRAWNVRTAEAPYSVLQLELVPRADDADADDWLDLEVDRHRVASVPLAEHRDIYALPLPRLTCGVHEVRLQARQSDPRPLRLPFALVRVSIEGAVGHVLAGERWARTPAGDPSKPSCASGVFHAS